jgi:hypothetical protein
MNQLEFQLSIEEANLILEGLGHLPFARVYRLVEKLQRQAGEQMKDTPEAVASTVPAFDASKVAGPNNAGTNGR